ncbi:MAG: DUF2490 domain-containing protein [Gammaproteobacteria bacterium]
MAILSLIAVSAVATGADEEGGLWAGVSVAKRLQENFVADATLQLRFDDDIDQLERVLLRPSFTYLFDDNQSFTLGYDAHFIEAPRTRVEQRAWQQYNVSRRFSNLTGSLRLRLEERFIDHVDGVPVRIRVKGGVTLPLAQSPWFFTVSNEAFLGLNEIRGGHRDGFHENRAYAGFGRALGGGTIGQIGYQNQFFDNRANDRMLHQFFISVSMKLP